MLSAVWAWLGERHRRLKPAVHRILSGPAAADPSARPGIDGAQNLRRLSIDDDRVVRREFTESMHFNATPRSILRREQWILALRGITHYYATGTYIVVTTERPHPDGVETVRRHLVENTARKSIAVESHGSEFEAEVERETDRLMSGNWTSLEVTVDGDLHTFESLSLDETAFVAVGLVPGCIATILSNERLPKSLQLFTEAGRAGDPPEP